MHVKSALHWKSKGQKVNEKKGERIVTTIIIVQSTIVSVIQSCINTKLWIRSINNLKNLY
jgi:hypothetical protein